MTIDTIIKDCEQSINQNELFIKAHQANMEIGEIKEYQYYIERDKLTIDTMRKYQQLQADYEARLKADLEAILVELQLEIEESENCGKAFHLGLQMASNIIQQKINEVEALDMAIKALEQETVSINVLAE